MRVLSTPLLILLLSLSSEEIMKKAEQINIQEKNAVNAKMEKKVISFKCKSLPLSGKIYTFSNGLKVTLIPYDSPGIVAYYTAMRVGSRDETEPGHSGFAHLFEHMMFRGTKKLPGSLYDDTVSKMGADSSAWTWNDQTVYFFVAPSDRIINVIEMEAERFKNLYYTVEDFKTETGAVLGEYNKNFSNPVNKLEEVLFDSAFKKHTYKHTTMGFLKDIKAMPDKYDYSLLFYRRHYVPAKAMIFVVGNFNESQVIDAIEKNYSDWKAEAWESKPRKEPEQKKEIRTHINWTNPVSPMMLIGYKVPAYSSEKNQSAAILLIAEMLFGIAGPLYKKLVLKEQIVEDISYWEWFLRDPGLFIVEVKLKNEKDFNYIINMIDEETGKIARAEFKKEEFEKAKSHYKYRKLLELDTAKSIAETLSFFGTLDGDPLSFDKFLGKLDETSKQDIQKAAQMYFLPSGRTVATLSFGRNSKGEKQK